MDFVDRPCNCNAATKINGLCAYGGRCRESIVVCKTTCLKCDKIYIGNTQQHLKTRMTQHFGDVKRLVTRGVASDSFAAHFATHYNPGDRATSATTRVMTKTEIIWKGDAISCMKSFGKLSCKLCMRERIAILKKARKEPDKLINSCGEIYGACRHKTKFHRCNQNTTPSTDDGANPERVFGNCEGNLDLEFMIPNSPPMSPPGDISVCIPVTVSVADV